MAEAIGTALARVATGTASTAPLIVDWASIDLTVLDGLPARLDDTALAKVEQIARLPVPVLTPAPEDHFLKCMRTLRLLPGRQDDDVSGELRLNLYRRHFAHYPAAALSYLAERATLELQWFPTPRECKAILDQWQRNDPEFHAIHFARWIARRERQERLDDARRRARAGELTQEEADALPEGLNRILRTEGVLNPYTGAVRPPWKPENKGGDNPTGEGPETADEAEKAADPQTKGPDYEQK